MTNKGSSLVPLFMVGVAAAVVGEMAFGLLLYESPGFLAALTLIAGVELAALATGLAARPEEGARGGRWRWFFAVGTVLIAGFGSVAWSFEADLMGSWTTRGYSLAALAALPMYGCGMVIAGLPVARGRSSGVPVVAGAAVGVVLTGTVLLVRLQPFGVYLFAVFCLAVAAFITAGQVAMETREAVRAVEEARRQAEMALAEQAAVEQAQMDQALVQQAQIDQALLEQASAELAVDGMAPDESRSSASDPGVGEPLAMPLPVASPPIDAEIPQIAGTDSVPTEPAAADPDADELRP